MFSQVDTTTSVMFTKEFVADNNYKIIDMVGLRLEKGAKKMNTGLMIQVLAGISAAYLATNSDIDDTLRIGIPLGLAGIGFIIQLDGSSNISDSGKLIRKLEFHR